MTDVEEKLRITPHGIKRHLRDFCLLKDQWDFPGCSEVKILSPQRGGMGSISVGELRSHMPSRATKKKKKKQNKQNLKNSIMTYLHKTNVELT